MQSTHRVAVIGGGIAGLAAAHHLVKAGCEVTLFEGSDRLGGLGTSFEREGRSHERFYHVMLPSDKHLLALLDETGLADRPYWRGSSMGFLYRNRTFRLDTAWDLLRFTALPFLDRLRVGLTGVYGALLRNGDALDDVTARDWLTRLSGARAFKRFWRPLLEAKFGDAFDQIPARWFWTRFRREKGGKKEVKGYPRGGYKSLAEGIAQSITDRGGQVCLSTPVEELRFDGAGRPVLDTALGSETYDQVLSTLPLSQLANVAHDDVLPDEVLRAVRGIDYQGVVNVVLLLRRSVIDQYWMPIVDSDAPFQGVVEATRVIDRSETGGHHLVYLMNYVHRSHELFSRDQASLAKEHFAALRRLFPHIEATDLVDAYLFRAPFVEPIYTVGYERIRPPTEAVTNRLYLATTAQVYPNVTSWNGSAELAARVVKQMVGANKSAPEAAAVGVEGPR